MCINIVCMDFKVCQIGPFFWKSILGVKIIIFMIFLKTTHVGYLEVGLLSKIPLLLAIQEF